MGGEDTSLPRLLSTGTRCSETVKYDKHGCFSYKELFRCSFVSFLQMLNSDHEAHALLYI